MSCFIASFATLALDFGVSDIVAYKRAGMSLRCCTRFCAISSARMDGVV
jgi:hypothetical protein